MLGRLIIAANVWLVVGCGSSVQSDPGPLVDNTQWRQTVEGEEFFVFEAASGNGRLSAELRLVEPLHG